MANKYRALLIQSLENNGGYSAGYRGSSPISYCVGLYYADIGARNMEALARDIHGADDWGPAPDLRWDESAVFYDIQWQMCDGINDDEGMKTLSPDVARRCGFNYKTPTGQLYYRRRGSKDCAYYPAKVEGWLIVNPYADLSFDVDFSLQGRQGKHLCIDSFEGKSLKGISADDLIDAVKHDDTYSNKWCQKLYAAMQEWDSCFTPKKASEEMEYLASMRFADEWRDRRNDWYDALSRARKARAAGRAEAVARDYWASRDVVTQG